MVDVNEQKARFYEGDEQIGWTTVASGVSTHPTPVGRFEVLEKVANKRSNLYGKVYGRGGAVVRSDAKSGRDPIPSGARFEGAKMPYFLRVTYDGVGLHAGPIPRPGRPASHGCIRLPSQMAPVLFEHVGVGTKVSIVGTGPDYGDYAQKQRNLAAERKARDQERREIAARIQANSPATAAAGTARGEPTLSSLFGSNTATPTRSPTSASAPVPEPSVQAQPVASTQPSATRPARVATAPRATPRPRSASQPQARPKPAAASASTVAAVQGAAPPAIESAHADPTTVPVTPPPSPAEVPPGSSVTNSAPAPTTPTPATPIAPVPAPVPVATPPVAAVPAAPAPAASQPAPAKPAEPAPAAAPPAAPTKPADPSPAAPAPAPTAQPTPPAGGSSGT